MYSTLMLSFFLCITPSLAALDLFCDCWPAPQTNPNFKKSVVELEKRQEKFFKNADQFINEHRNKQIDRKTLDEKLYISLLTIYFGHFSHGDLKCMRTFTQNYADQALADPCTIL